MERCPICGTKLKETNWGRKFCPNCDDFDENKESEVEDPEYIG